MKKILSLILAFCMTLAAVPALAEDFAGDWYFIMLGMTVGTMELKAEGSAVVHSQSGDEETTREGTWTAEGDTVTVNIDDQPLSLVYDGSALKLDVSAMEAMGLSGDSLGMDSSTMDALLQISREPGKVTVKEFNAFTENGTLPEGRTQEEMEAIQMEMMTALFGMLGQMGGAVSDGASGAGETLEVTVLEDNFYVRKARDEQLEGYYLAKVQNQNDAPLYINEVTLTLKDAEGNEVGKTDYMSNCGSLYLEPGEISFVSMKAYAEGGAPAAYEASIQGTSLTYGTDVQLEAAHPELRKQDSYGWANYYAGATITNTGDVPLSQVNAVIAIRDASGALIDLVQAGLYQNELAVGSTITLLDSVDSTTVDYCTENGTDLGEVEALAWVNVAN